ncbi:Putative addiction module component [Bremerella volcania]|uniref:Addiction module component n=1 Tax=Bremerella volcania TaxID=2527984 RepID=A0A518C7Z6_9BACT|nr:addiction module protein [Bremerella volcania]QDU75339.1 Putative addiction module component [Bremerella volcania]
MISISQLTKDALSLPPEERARLAQTLLESIDSSLPGAPDAELISVLKRRVKELDDGVVQAIPLAQAMEQARRSLQ